MGVLALLGVVVIVGVLVAFSFSIFVVEPRRGRHQRRRGAPR